MADVLDSVRTYLLTKTAVTDLIGQRLYIEPLPQAVTLPAAFMEIISGEDAHLISDRAGYVEEIVSFECHAARLSGANDIGNAIRRCGVTTVKGVTNGLNIRAISVESGRRNWRIEALDASDDHRYACGFDLKVSYRED